MSSVRLPDDLSAEALALPHEYVERLNREVRFGILSCRAYAGRMVDAMPGRPAVPADFVRMWRDLVAAGLAAAHSAAEAPDPRSARNWHEVCEVLGRRAAVSTGLARLDLSDDDVQALLDDGTDGP